MPISVEVRLGAAPHNREDAVRAAGALLAQAGHVLPAYVDSLLQREKLANTFLGQGVAIPHGMIEDRHLVQSTGLAVLQVPAGVRWGEDRKTFTSFREGRGQVCLAAGVQVAAVGTTPSCPAGSVSTPSAITEWPRPCAMATIAATIGLLGRCASMRRTKSRSILIVCNGRRSR